MKAELCVPLETFIALHVSPRMGKHLACSSGTSKPKPAKSSQDLGGLNSKDQGEGKRHSAVPPEEKNGKRKDGEAVSSAKKANPGINVSMGITPHPLCMPNSPTGPLNGKPIDAGCAPLTVLDAASILQIIAFGFLRHDWFPQGMQEQ